MDIVDRKKTRLNTCCGATLVTGDEPPSQFVAGGCEEIPETV